MRGGSNPGVPLVSSVPRISISKEELASTIQDLVTIELSRATFSEWEFTKLLMQIRKIFLTLR